MTITGTNFTGATAVTFGGTAATSFTVANATTITATVGSGADRDDHRHHALRHGEQQRDLYLRDADHRGDAQRHPDFPGDHSARR